MFTEPITHNNLPEAIAALLSEVRSLKAELKEYKQPQEWVTMGEAERLTGKCKKTIVKKRVEFSKDTPHITGTVRYIKDNHTVALYNRNDLLTLYTK